MQVALKMNSVTTELKLEFRESQYDRKSVHIVHAAFYVDLDLEHNPGSRPVWEPWCAIQPFVL